MRLAGKVWVGMGYIVSVSFYSVTFTWEIYCSDKYIVSFTWESYRRICAYWHKIFVIICICWFEWKLQCDYNYIKTFQ